MATGDVAEVFDRVSLASILRATKRMGMDEKFTNYIRGLYETGSTVMKFEEKTLLAYPSQGVAEIATPHPIGIRPCPRGRWRPWNTV